MDFDRSGGTEEPFGGDFKGKMPGGQGLNRVI